MNSNLEKTITFDANIKKFKVGVIMVDYEIKIEENRKRNEKYIKEFEMWLNGKGLVNKTIKKHLNNIDLYINDYLNYYDVIKVENGMEFIHLFLDGWFIEKCLWASKNSLKEMAASIKKFYQYMSEKNYVSVDDYKEMCSFIKESMDEFLEQLDAFEDGTYYDIF